VRPIPTTMLAIALLCSALGVVIDVITADWGDIVWPITAGVWAWNALAGQCVEAKK
jgi:hypothetical protein